MGEEPVGEIMMLPVSYVSWLLLVCEGKARPTWFYVSVRIRAHLTGFGVALLLGELVIHECCRLALFVAACSPLPLSSLA